MRWLLVILAVAALAGCRTRLPVERAPAAVPVAAATDPVAAGSDATVSRWREAVQAVTEAPSGRSRYHREITPDRLSDFLRREPYRERPGMLPSFFLPAPPVCLPHH